ncbi:MAG TPA: hypothetical protein VFE62_06685 [Gemmataceae bacterium]|nr:hypothetical protein [Gemmataceae bacterium]
MARKLALAVFAMTVCIGIVAADEFTAIITKVDGGKVSFYKTKKGKKDGEEVTLPAADKVEVVKGKFNKDDKKFVAGDAIEGGLKAELFTKISEKGVAARIVTDDDGKKIKTIMVVGGKKKKNAN